MLKQNKFIIIGGDQRQLLLYASLKQKGYDVDIIFNNDYFSKQTQLKKVSNAKIVIFPIPTSQDQIHLFAPNYKERISLEEIIQQVSSDAVLFIGGENNIFTALKTKCTVNLLSDEVMTLKNAMATAEAALSIIINNTSNTVFGSKILVLGYGRIARILSQYLTSLHANVTICARKELAKTTAYLEGMTAIGFDSLNEKLPENDVIVNTVPDLILDKNKLELANKNSLIIDLASKPGGLDFDAAESLNIKYIQALSLPGKFSPKSSAEYIEEAIFNTLL